MGGFQGLRKVSILRLSSYHQIALPHPNPSPNREGLCLSPFGERLDRGVN